MAIIIDLSHWLLLSTSHTPICHAEPKTSLSVHFIPNPRRFYMATRVKISPPSTGVPLASAASLPASLSCEWPCSFSLTLEGAIGFGTSFLSLDSAHSTSFYNTWHRCSIFWEDFPPSPLLLLCFHKALHISHFFPLSIFKYWLCMKMPSHLNSYMSFNTHNNPARQAPSSSPCY